MKLIDNTSLIIVKLLELAVHLSPEGIQMIILTVKDLLIDSLGCLHGTVYLDGIGEGNAYDLIGVFLMDRLAHRTVINGIDIVIIAIVQLVHLLSAPANIILRVNLRLTLILLSDAIATTAIHPAIPLRIIEDAVIIPRMIIVDNL